MSGLCLVTGGSGYFGSLLVQRLRAQNRRVRIFDVNDANDRPEDVEFCQGDIRDVEAVQLACQDVSVAFHCVAMVPLAKDKQAFWAVNRDGTHLMLEACLKAGVQKMVYVSSSAVYGAPDTNPVTEDSVPVPQEDYGRAKLAAEKLCFDYSQDGFSVGIIRPRTIMGHGRLGIMQILFEWIRQGKKIPTLGGGQNVYQFVQADDLAYACILASERSETEIYNIGAANYGTMRETLQGVIDHAGTSSRVISFPMGPTVAMMNLTSLLGLSPLGPYHALMYGRSLYFDLTKAETELGWSPRYGNVDMFCQSYDWYLKNRESVLNIRSGVSHHRSGMKQGVLKMIGWFL